MKKIQALLVILFCAGSLCAQEFHGGFLLGACGTQVDGDRLGGYNKAGLLAGFLVRYPLSEKITLQTEIKYFPKGSRMRQVYDNGYVDFYQMSLHYIELPLILSYPLTYKKHNFSVELGLAESYLFSSKEEDEYQIIISSVDFSKFETSAMFGINYHVNDHIIVNTKWHYSMRKIRPATSGDYPFMLRYIFNNGQYNNVISLSVYFVL